MTFESGSSCASLCLSAFAVGCSVRVTFPALGLQVQLHQPPAQEKLAGDTDADVCVEMLVGTWSPVTPSTWL